MDWPFAPVDGVTVTFFPATTSVFATLIASSTVSLPVPPIFVIVIAPVSATAALPPKMVFTEPAIVLIVPATACNWLPFTASVDVAVI